MRARCATGCWWALGAACGVALCARAEQVVVSAPAYLAPSGEIVKDALIVMEDGVICQVGGPAPGAGPGSGAVHAFDQGVACPGLIDVRSSLGAYGQLSEPASAIESGANAGDAFDPYHPDMRGARQAGVTCVALVPADNNLVGGRVAVVKTFGRDGRAYILTEAGPFRMSLAARVLESDREPTSRSGAIAMLREALGAARGSSPLADVVGGKVGVLAAAPTAPDVLAFLQLAAQYKMRVAIEHDGDPYLTASALGAARATAIVGPHTLSQPRRSLAAAGLFEQAGATVVLAGGLPEGAADSLRLTAALAVRNGMTAAAARRGITSAAAEALGVSDRVGSLAPGLSGDVVIFSGDPLDLRSRVVAVFVDGRRVRADALP